MRPPPRPRRVVAETRRQRALAELLVDNDGIVTAAGVIAQLPKWMRPYFRAWDTHEHTGWCNHGSCD